MTWNELFFQWFLAELLKALQAQAAGLTGDAGLTLAPRPEGFTVDESGQAVMRDRSSLIDRRPGQVLSSVDAARRRWTLGDGQRHRPLTRLRDDGVVPPIPVEFVPTPPIGVIANAEMFATLIVLFFEDGVPGTLNTRTVPFGAMIPNIDTNYAYDWPIADNIQPRVDKYRPVWGQWSDLTDPYPWERFFAAGKLGDAWETSPYLAGHAVSLWRGVAFGSGGMPTPIDGDGYFCAPDLITTSDDIERPSGYNLNDPKSEQAVTARVFVAGPRVRWYMPTFDEFGNFAGREKDEAGADILYGTWVMTDPGGSSHFITRQFYSGHLIDDFAHDQIQQSVGTFHRDTYNEVGTTPYDRLSWTPSGAGNSENHVLVNSVVLPATALVRVDHNNLVTVPADLSWADPEVNPGQPPILVTRLPLDGVPFSSVHRYQTVLLKKVGATTTPFFLGYFDEFVEEDGLWYLKWLQPAGSPGVFLSVQSVYSIHLYSIFSDETADLVWEFTDTMSWSAEVVALVKPRFNPAGPTVQYTWGHGAKVQADRLMEVRGYNGATLLTYLYFNHTGNPPIVNFMNDEGPSGTGSTFTMPFDDLGSMPFAGGWFAEASPIANAFATAFLGPGSVSTVAIPNGSGPYTGAFGPAYDSVAGPYYIYEGAGMRFHIRNPRWANNWREPVRDDHALVHPLIYSGAHGTLHNPFATLGSPPHSVFLGIPITTRHYAADAFYHYTDFYDLGAPKSLYGVVLDANYVLHVSIDGSLVFSSSIFNFFVCGQPVRYTVTSEMNGATTRVFPEPLLAGTYQFLPHFNFCHRDWPFTTGVLGPFVLRPFWPPADQGRHFFNGSGQPPVVVRMRY